MLNTHASRYWIRGQVHELVQGDTILLSHKRDNTLSRALLSMYVIIAV